MFPDNPATLRRRESVAPPNVLSQRSGATFFNRVSLTWKRIVLDNHSLHSLQKKQDTMAAADSDKRFALIKENLAEVLNEEIIKKILDEGQHPKIYWGM